MPKQNISLKKVTPNGLYGTKRSDGSSRLYVKKGTSAPRGVQKSRTKKTYIHNGNKYERYKPARQAYPDCLHHTEEIINNKSLQPGGGTYSREKTTNRVWGQNDKRNMEIAKKAEQTSPNTVNEKANPDVGEGFCIARTVATTSGYPYHAAPVVAKDGNNHVTMETFAGSTDATQRNATPTFRIYSPQHNFHNTWEGAFNGDVTTVAIKKKDQ